MTNLIKISLLLSTIFIPAAPATPEWSMGMTAQSIIRAHGSPINTISSVRSEDRSWWVYKYPQYKTEVLVGPKGLIMFTATGTVGSFKLDGQRYTLGTSFGTMMNIHGDPSEYVFDDNMNIMVTYEKNPKIRMVFTNKNKGVFLTALTCEVTTPGK